nr:PREDICTED: interferon-induced protein 44-like [Lepisosteus oculatus]
MGGSKSVPEPSPDLNTPWRETKWTREEKERLMKEIRNLTPRYKEAKELRIMMTGQIKAGKSSYVNTVNSVFQGYLTSRALAGKDTHSFTKKLTPYYVEDPAKGKDGFLPFVIYDIMGIDHILTRPDDFIGAVKGHIRDGYTFNPISPLSDDSPYFNKNPTVNDRTHCLVYIVAADQLSIMGNHVLKLINEIRSNASDLEIPQVVLLTKVDLACPLVAGDLKKVYRSRYIKHQIEKASKILGIPVNCILPVKNYHEQISLNDETDVLALTSLLQILRFANDYLQNLYQQKYKTELQSIQ